MRKKQVKVGDVVPLKDKPGLHKKIDDTTYVRVSEYTRHESCSPSSAHQDDDLPVPVGTTVVIPPKHDIARKDVKVYYEDLPSLSSITGTPSIIDGFCDMFGMNKYTRMMRLRVRLAYWVTAKLLPRNQWARHIFMSSVQSGSYSDIIPFA